ncbi:hypothetical protein KXD40_006334 [Peronospora effusa]|uniref:Uncharacterized protein n=1 Tax=Peronospora effusa TaxID=542832 RepID=A0A3M6VSP9_9STRA|nr:hypothetical protein DD238_002076 [Peronospora effusa]UIZ25893.1 hypothetical protein KXD40_006334 [Peronospora effusa]
MARAGKCFECVLQGEVEDIAYKEYVYNFDEKCPQYIQGVPHYEVRARHVFSGSTTFQGEAVEMPSDGGQKWELRYIGRWERKKLSEHGGSALLGVPFRSQIAVSVGQNLKSEDEKDEYRLVDLENLRVEALLVEIFALTTDEKIDEASQKIRRFAVDLDPYFVERPSEGKEILHSTATLAAEVRRKRPRP